jgi:hypothetical protein
MTEEAIEHTYSVPDTASLRLENIRGTIEIKPGSPGEFYVSAYKHENSGDADRTEIVMEQADDGSVLVKTRYREPWFGAKPCKVDYVASVPPGCKVYAAGVSASVTATGLNGDIELSTVSGAIRLDNSQGKIRLHSVSGSIEAQGLAAAGPLDVENVSGRLTLKNVQANAVNARTVSGRIDVETTLGDGPYRFNSVSGDVTLIIPAEAGCHVRMKSLSGRLRAYLPVTFQSKSHGHQEVEIDGGGPVIEFDSVSGGMRVMGPEGVHALDNRAVEEPEAEQNASAPNLSSAEILDRIERGEISVEDGINLLKS